jgi:hypothetical protein
MMRWEEFGELIDDSVPMLEAAALGHNIDALLVAGPATPLQAYATIIGACYFFGRPCQPVGPADAPTGGVGPGIFAGASAFPHYLATVARLTPNHLTAGADGLNRLGSALVNIVEAGVEGPQAMLAAAAEELFSEAIQQIYAAGELQTVRRATADALNVFSRGLHATSARRGLFEGLPDGLTDSAALSEGLVRFTAKYGGTFAALRTFYMTKYFVPGSEDSAAPQQWAKTNKEAAPFLSQEAASWGPISAPIAMVLKGLRTAAGLESSQALESLDNALSIFEEKHAAQAGFGSGLFIRGTYAICFAAATARDVINLTGSTSNSYLLEVASDIYRDATRPMMDDEGNQHRVRYAAPLVMAAAGALSVMPVRHTIRPDRMHTHLLHDGEVLAAIALYYPEAFDAYMDAPYDEGAREAVESLMSEARSLSRTIAPMPLSALAQNLRPNKVSPFLSAVQTTPRAKLFNAAAKEPDTASKGTKTRSTPSDDE